MPFRIWDPTFSFDAYPDPDPTPTFFTVWKIVFFSFFTLLHCFIFLVSIVGVAIFNILYSKLKVIKKLYNSALHLVEVDPDPDPPK